MERESAAEEDDAMAGNDAAEAAGDGVARLDAQDEVGSALTPRYYDRLPPDENGRRECGTADRCPKPSDTSHPSTSKRLRPWPTGHSAEPYL